MKFNVKRKLPLVVAALCMVVVVVVVLAMTGEKEENQSEMPDESGGLQSGEDEDGTADFGGDNNGDNGNFSEDAGNSEDVGMNMVGMEELGELGMIDAQLPITITCGNYYGSGFVIERNEEEIIIAAPKHLLLGNEAAIVGLSDGSTLTGVVSKLSQEYDVGYIRIERAVVTDSQSELLYETITANESYYEALQVDDTVKLMIGEDEWQEGTLSNPYFFSVDVNSYAAQIEMKLEHGQSGMPVYDKNNVCVGMIIAGSETAALYLPVTIIFTEYFIY